MSYTFPFVKNGTFTSTHAPPYQLGDVATIQCNPGYTTHTTISVFSLENGLFTWIPASITCLPVSCGEPSYLKNGYHMGTQYHFPARIIYKCLDGYILNTKIADQYCSTRGTWTPTFNGQCVPVQCDELAVPENGSVSYHPDRFFDSIARYACQPGFMMFGGNGERQCLSNGNWSGENVTCEKLPCPKLPNTLNFKYESDNFAIIDCHGKDVTIRCKPDGTWTQSPPYCPAPNVIPVAVPRPNIPVAVPRPNIPVAVPRPNIPVPRPNIPVAVPRPNIPPVAAPHVPPNVIPVPAPDPVAVPHVPPPPVSTDPPWWFFTMFVIGIMLQIIGVVYCYTFIAEKWKEDRRGVLAV